ncbi:hypothetical protein AB0478_17585 [Streptomyces sp. NPDC051917]|uniref:hypothetical protein n=1 Tax=Streptomyces sp. NPDC051917 TaxID=3154754 RepID=UPI00344B29DD
MRQWDWFEEDEEDDLSHAQRVFLAALRARAGAWLCHSEDTQLVEPEDGCPHWRAVLDVPAQIENLYLITVGVCFDGTRILGGELHDQSFYPHPIDQSGVDVIDAVGTPEGLAQVAADWFERILARPVERREWESNGNTASEYVFSDTGAGICRGGQLVPGAYRRPPDRITPARGMHCDPAG